jgi:cytoskeletal protein CcmA (bactofilin family)
MKKRNSPDPGNGAATYVAPGTKIVGNLSGEGAYIFCGEIDGECDINGPVTIAEGSHWKGSIRATDIVIAGSVEGDVTAKQRVEVSGSARISGSLRGSSIIVAEGAVIEGEVSITQAKESQRSPDEPITSRLGAAPAKS